MTMLRCCLSVSAILASLFVIGSTLTFDWRPIAKALVISAHLGLIAVNCVLLYATRSRSPQ